MCSLVSAVADAPAQQTYTPAAGSAEREAIMDALPVPAEKDLKQEVIFKVSMLRVIGDWAFARVERSGQTGKRLTTKWRVAREEVACNAEAETLLPRRGGAAVSGKCSSGVSPGPIPRRRSGSNNTALRPRCSSRS